MIKIQSDRFRIEFDAITEMVQEWKERLDKGIPGVELPADDVRVERFEVHLKAELQLLASKIFGLSEAIE